MSLHTSVASGPIRRDKGVSELMARKPLPTVRALIDDAAVAPDMVRTLYEMGYCPYLVPNDKNWLTVYDDVNLQWGHTDADPDVSDLLNVLNSNPHYGVGFSVRRFQTKDFFPYYVDIDIFDEEALADLRSLLPPGAVSWRGTKAGALLFRRSGEHELTKKVHALDKKSRHFMMGDKGGTGNKIVVPRFKVHPRHSGAEGKVKVPQIEFLSEKSESHAVLPPTLHTGALQDYGETVRYSWIPGQPTHLDTSPDRLPWIRDFHLLIIYEWCRNPESDSVNFFRSSGAGEFHDRMVKAVHHLAHEGWEQEDIELAIMDKVRRFDDKYDDAKLREREGQVKDALRGSFKTLKKKGGPDPSKPVGSKSVPLERQIVLYLQEMYPPEDTREFRGDIFNWRDGEWHMLTNFDRKAPMKDLLNQIADAFPSSKDRDMTAAIRIWERSITSHDTPADSHVLVCSNGAYDLRTNSLREEVREDFAFGRLKIAYNPNATCPTWDAFIEHLCRPPRALAESPEYGADHEKAMAMMQEFLGYSLFASLRFRHMLYLVGASTTGKSQMALTIAGMVPEGWTTEVALDAIEDAPSRYEMRHSRLNIGSEIGRRSRNVDDLLFRITTGEKVQIKKLYENPYNVILPTRLIFHGNKMPESADAHGALMNRMLLIRTTDQKPAKIIAEYHKVLLQEAEGILLKLINAYRLLLDRGEFVKPSYHEEAAAQQLEGSNSVQMWLASGRVIVTEDHKSGTSSEELYSEYKDWCSEFYPGHPLNLYQWGGRLEEAGHASKIVRFGHGRARMRNLKVHKHGRMAKDGKF